MLTTVLSFLGRPLLKYGIVAIIASGVLYGGYTFVENYFQYKQNVETLKQTVEQQNEQMNFILEEQKRLQALNNNLVRENRNAEAKLNSIAKKIEEADLLNLSTEKPAQIEKIINKATKDVFKNIEEITDPNTDSDSTSSGN